jgi:Leucine-rich repeat (LRR) protein
MHKWSKLEYKVGLSSPVSTWYGVKLEGDKIVSINLSDNNLVGEIPNEIVNLTDLKELNLQKRISGVIPSALENLKELVGLDFHLIN